jgi:uncharacterized membrane protein
MSSVILFTILAIVVIAAVVLFIAMFTEMGTKHKTGQMKSTKTQHKSRKK